MAEESRNKQVAVYKVFPLEISVAAQVVHEQGAELYRNKPYEFKIEGERRELYSQLLYYFLNRPEFKGDLSKGILIVGQIGVGKTDCFEIFKEFVKATTLDTFPWTKGFEIEYPKKIAMEFSNEKDGGPTLLQKYMGKNAIMFDDLGKEVEDGFLPSHYGVKANVMKEILDARYRNFKKYGTKTHATSNYHIGKTLSPINSNKRVLRDFYGDYIADRMNEMFNVLVITGESLRK